MSLGAWRQETVRTYTGNATSMRDFRVQMRGGRSVLLFGVYLVLLIGIALIVYNNSTSGSSVSIVEAQQSLNNFYMTVMALLGGAISIVTPALSATAVVQERLRRSLDLVFSAPVTPKYYLVGKILSTYRYAWMLLVLSFPVTAACVVLGGASWTDVLYAYILLSFHGLLFSSIALLVSSYASKATGSVVLTYTLVILLLFAQVSMAAGMLTRGFMGSATNEQPFFVGLSPFFVSQSALTYTIIRGIQVPNVGLVGIATLLVVRFCLLAAGALLRPYGGREVKAVRINGAVYLFIIAGMTGYYTSGWSSMTSSMTLDIYWGREIGYCSLIFAFLVPSLSAFGYESERRLWNDGIFRLRKVFDGTPSGNLPYLIVLIVLVGAGLLLGQYFSSTVPLVPGISILGYVVFVIGLWAFFWSIGRYASATTLQAKTGRSAVAVAILILLVLPPTILASAFPDLYDQSQFTVWDLYLLRPITQSDPSRPTQALTFGLVMAVAAFIIAGLSQARFRRTLKKGSNLYVAIAETQTV